MKTLEEQLKELPEEFVIEMEQQKKDRWADIYSFLIKFVKQFLMLNKVLLHTLVIHIVVI